MSKAQPTRRRLDEILLAEGMVSEAEITAALQRQKGHGGKFGSQLLQHGDIEEAALVRALSLQFGCKGVVLGGRHVAENALKTIPRRVCLSRRVLPFAIEADTEVLKVACEDPADPDLERELSFITGGRKVQLYVAAELALDSALTRYCVNRDVVPDDGLLEEIPDDLTDVTPTPWSKMQAARGPAAVLLVTDEVYTAPLLRSLFERDGYRAVIAPTASAALSALDRERFAAVFIRDTVPGDCLHVVDRVRRLSPKTLIRFYGSASSLVFSQSLPSVEADMLLINCDLFTSLLSSQVGLPSNHGGQVGRFADRLCRRLELPDKDRLLIANAGYVHDLARYYYRTPEAQDGRQMVQLTIRLLQSFDYSPVVIDMLRAMYTTLGQQSPQRLPLELLAGNILTIADSAADRIPPGQPLSLDRFDGLKRSLRDMSGVMFLPDVVEAFIQMLQEDILDRRTRGQTAEVVVYTDDPERTAPLGLRLKNDGFRIAVLDTVARLVAATKRRLPDILILDVGTDKAGVTRLIADLAAAGIKGGEPPILLLAEASASPLFVGLLENGIEDIIARDDNLDLLIRRLERLAERVASQRTDHPESEGSGARGRVADMNLLDLLQALGPSCKTVRITVRPARAAGPAQLNLYLNSGVITFARYADLTGAEAVHEGLTWTDGTWAVDPVEESSLPPPNILQSNESILMEGCRLLDEKARAGQPQ